MSQKPKDTAEEKKKIQKAKTKLQQMVFKAKKRILEGDLEVAYDQLYKAISEQKDNVGGDDSVFLLPGLFTLAEIQIMNNHVKKAEEYLNAAHWSFLKSNDKLSNDKKKEKGIILTTQQQLTTKINLHKTFAKLYQLKGDYKQAIGELKQSIYLQSTKHGPQHPYIASSYFLMGKFFIDSGNASAGQAFFAKVSEIWYRYLKNYCVLGAEQQETFLLEQLSLEEAVNYLTFIQKHFQQTYDEEQTGIVFTPVTHTLYAIGLLFKIFGDESQCQNYLKQVYRRCLKYLPENHKKTTKMKEILISMNIDLYQAEKELTQRYQKQPQNEGNKQQNQLMQVGDNAENDGLEMM